MKREKELKTVAFMIGKYCRGVHKRKRGELCEECEELLSYAELRLSKCPFKDEKNFCSNCKIHCYQPEKRDMIKRVMRYSGPRMIFSHPILSIVHLIETKREKKKLDKEAK
ncbi:MAG: nitrous oxide-stimulated promoter family protein [Clostridia bacterium]|nr:nitrous oxide-stimulated promoter family protein [Clostridia bacterium]